MRFMVESMNEIVPAFFQFSLWDSIAKELSKETGEKILLILFMRFKRLEKEIMQLKSRIFQFSLWDSVNARITSPSLRSIAFQFSLWDSYYICKFGGEKMENFQFSLWDSRKNSIVSINIDRVIFQFSLWDSEVSFKWHNDCDCCLSILFMRFIIS